MICSTIKIRPANKISVLYLQNQASYSDFSLVNVMRNLHFTQFWNPEISLKFWDFGPNFCMWPLNIQTNKFYLATWGQRWLLFWYLRGGLWGPPIGATESDRPCKAEFCSECFAANKPEILFNESQSAVTRIGEKMSWKLKVEKDLVSDTSYEVIAALDEDLKTLKT